MGEAVMKYLSSKLMVMSFVINALNKTMFMKLCFSSEKLQMSGFK